MLYEGGYDGTVAVEHEDAVWTGAPDKVETGLELGYRSLRPLIPAEG